MDQRCWKIKTAIWKKIIKLKGKRPRQLDFIKQSETDNTKRALEDLKEFCKSPKCNFWKLIARIKYPKR